MAKKRTNPKRRTSKTSKRKKLKFQIGKIIGGLGLLVLLVAGGALLVHFLIPVPSGPSKAAVPPGVRKTIPQKAERIPVPQAKTIEQPTYEVFPRKTLPPPKPLEKITPPSGHQPPLVAIIVDDIGYDQQIADLLLQLDVPLTFSMLPYGPFNRQIAADARAKGNEIMLHLPMEPDEFPAVNPGPGALLADMSPDELIGVLNKNLERVEGISGVNNHMGSRLSTSPEHMRQIFSILKKRGLFYVDSRTTADTVARSSARLLQLPFAERDIFIDHDDDPKFIHSQLERLIERAERQGYAVAIAHPHMATLKALREFLPLLKEKVELVPASVLVQTVMQAEAEKAHAARASMNGPPSAQP